MIREYKDGDKTGIEECIKELQDKEASYLPDYWNDGETSVKDGYFDYLLDKIIKRHGKVLVKDVEGKIAGFVAIIMQTEEDVSPCYKIKRFGYVTDLVVLDEFKMQGFGRELMDAAEKYVKSQNCDHVMLNVTFGNDSLDFYKKIGFKENDISLLKKI